jgi:probable F420-dependent oxidoreductase
MVRPFRFAVQAMELQDAEALATSARRIEELGYAELYSYDHLGAADPFAPLMVAASATTRLRVGPLVLNNEFHHPALLARTAATVDRLTGGRLVLGIGTGYAEQEHQAAGIELRPPGPRVDRLQESLHAIRGLLDDGAVSMDGQHHHLAIEDLGVRPLQERVPLLVGGHGERVIRTAAQVADIFQFTGLTRGEGGAPEPGGFAFGAIAERARWLRDAAGDRHDDIERSVLVQAVVIGAEADAAADRASERLDLDRTEIASSPFVLFGSVEQVVDELEARRESLGISHVVVRDAESFAPVVEALADR